MHPSQAALVIEACELLDEGVYRIGARSGNQRWANCAKVEFAWRHVGGGHVAAGKDVSWRARHRFGSFLSVLFLLSEARFGRERTRSPIADLYAGQDEGGWSVHGRPTNASTFFTPCTMFSTSSLEKSAQSPCAALFRIAA